MKYVDIQYSSCSPDMLKKFDDYIISTYPTGVWILCGIHTIKGAMRVKIYADDVECVKRFFLVSAPESQVEIVIIGEGDAAHSEIRKVLADQYGEDGEEKGEEFFEKLELYKVR